jgi:dihydropteroate synthase
MGILNVTSDSFSDGGRYEDPAAAVMHAERLIAEGAAILDVGGESTRPGADAVPIPAELSRVRPVIGRFSGDDTPLSIDTPSRSAAAACEAVRASSTMYPGFDREMIDVATG